MTDHRTANCSCRRTDGPAAGGTASHLFRLALAGLCAGFLRHVRALDNVSLRSRFPDLLKMDVGIENGLGCGTGGEK